MTEVVVGSINVDLSIQLERWLRVGETIEARGFAHALGGEGANQCTAAARCRRYRYAWSNWFGMGNRRVQRIVRSACRDGCRYGRGTQLPQRRDCSGAFATRQP